MQTRNAEAEILVGDLCEAGGLQQRLQLVLIGKTSYRLDQVLVGIGVAGYPGTQPRDHRARENS